MRKDTTISCSLQARLGQFGVRHAHDASRADLPGPRLLSLDDASSAEWGVLGACRCHYSDADLDGLNLLFLNEDDDETTVMPRAGWEMFSCFTKVHTLSPRRYYTFPP